MTLLDYYRCLPTSQKEANLPNYKKLSDKGMLHSYIEQYYSPRFTDLRERPLAILEIGVKQGRSVWLWRNWFKNSSIYGIDVKEESIKTILTFDNVKGYVGNAFSEKMLSNFNDNFFDIIIEDGPHTLQTQIFAAKNWSKKLKRNGLLIIEDVQKEEYISTILQSIPNEVDIKFESKVFDFRNIKNRYDDILIEITRV